MQTGVWKILLSIMFCSYFLISNFPYVFLCHYLTLTRESDWLLYRILVIDARYSFLILLYLISCKDGYANFLPMVKQRKEWICLSSLVFEDMRRFSSHVPCVEGKVEAWNVSTTTPLPFFFWTILHHYLNNTHIIFIRKKEMTIWRVFFGILAL